MATNIHQLNLQDPEDQQKLARLRRQQTKSTRLYLVTDDPPAEAETSTEDILDASASTQATLKHLSQLMVEQRIDVLHCDPYPDRVWVRGRIDGRLNRIGSLPITNYRDLVDYLKVQAGLELENDICQTGQLSWSAGRLSFTARLQVNPTVNGPKLTLQRQSLDGYPGLGELGFWGQARRQLEQALGRSRGLVLFVSNDRASRQLSLGTAEALLLADQRLSLARLTDQPGLTQPHQTLIQPALGQTQASWLTAQLAGDNDVLIVDQLLDRRSCQLAVEAAISRQLVLATMPGCTPGEAIATLRASQLEPHLLAAAQPTVVASQLVGRLKPQPKPKKKVAIDWLKVPLWAEFGFENQPQAIEELVDQAALAATQIGGHLSRPRPATEGNYQGQIMLTMVQAGDQLDGLPTASYKPDVAPGTQIDLARDGLVKICLGLTTPPEVKRVLANRRQLPDPA